MKVWWIIILALGLVGTATFLPVIKTTEGVATVTGTTFTTTAWLGLPPVSGKQESPLANWCHAHGVTVTEQTVFYSKITKNIWGFAWSRSSGRAPSSYYFTPAMQKAWLARASEAEVQRFIDAMMATDEVGRSRLIDKACDQASAGN